MYCVCLKGLKPTVEAHGRLLGSGKPMGPTKPMKCPGLSACLHTDHPPGKIFWESSFLEREKNEMPELEIHVPSPHQQKETAKRKKKKATTFHSFFFPFQKGEQLLLYTCRASPFPYQFN
jgi:hypothetical protein